MKRAFDFRRIVFVLVAVFSGTAHAQDLPKIIQPSPETAALFRFQDYPMDYSTGLPNISIPLYEVKSGSLSLPISISNHASGRRITDQDGPVALGWSLNAGGAISRTSYGSVDFGIQNSGTYNFPTYPMKTTNINNVTDISYLENLNHFSLNPNGSTPGTWLDGEYDVFSYSIGGSGGKFIFKDSNGVKTAALLPYKPYVITPHYNFNVTMQGLTGIDILDDKGVLYVFSVQEKLSSNGDVTSLYLKQIISADKSDTITFIYTGFTQWRLSYSQQRILNDAIDAHYGGGYLEEPQLTDVENANQESYTIQRLSEIDFKQGKVLFNLVSGNDKIDNIQILNLSNQVIKTIQFNRSQLDYFTQGGTSSTPSMTQTNNKLDALLFKDNIGNVAEKYSFQYYPTYGTIDPHYCDWWGFYNASGTLNMIPRYTGLPFTDVNIGVIGTIDVGGTNFNREPSLAALKSGMLQKIFYPTGGSSEFIYENNQYYSNTSGQTKVGPGLRVAQINTDDNRGTVMTKTYKYGPGENGYGSLDIEPKLEFMASESVYQFYPLYEPVQTTGTYRERIFFGDFLPDVKALADRPVIYTTVTEYNGTTTSNTGKTVYTYDNHQWGAANYQGFNSSATIIKYHINTFNYWDNPSLLTKTDYKNVGVTTGNVNYAVKKTVSNVYVNLSVEDVAGIHIQRFYKFTQNGLVQGTNYYPEEYGIKTKSLLVYPYSDYHIPVGAKNLISTTETLYNDDGSVISTITTNSYNAKNYVSTTVSTGADNIPYSKQITYPFDYTGNAVLTQMVSPGINMLSFPVEVADTKNTTVPLKSVRTNFYDANAGTGNPAMIVPQTVDVKKGSNAYETRLHYYGYDNTGNPVSVSKENDVVHSYIWDYAKTYPIAEVINASPANIAYTSFEADGSGNWNNIAPASIKSDVPGITGSKYYNLAGTTLTVNGLTATQTYLVSYWSRNGACTMSGTAVSGWPKNLKTVTINGVGWSYWEHKVTGVTTLSISGSVNIDELRLYPAASQMTSYTFQPLVGMTSQCDVNNRISYYEYDSYGRLKIVRDLNGHILKTLSYQYQSTTP